MATALSPPPLRALATADPFGLLRARLMAAMVRLKPTSQIAYYKGLVAFADWFQTWAPTATGPIGDAIAGPIPEDPWDCVSVLLRAGALAAPTVVETYMTEACSNLAPASVALRLAALRWVFHVARDCGMISWDLRVRGPHVRPYRDTRGPGLDGVQAMAHVAAQQEGILGARDAVLLALLFVLGLRRSEVAGLRRADYVARGRTVRIMGKGRDDSELISVPPELATAIDRLLEEMGDAPDDAPLLMSQDASHRYVGGLTPNGIYRRVVALAKKAGVEEPVSPHRLRHSGITAALDTTGGDVRRVRAFARHAKAETTLGYDDRRKDVAGEVAGLLSGLFSKRGE